MDTCVPPPVKLPDYVLTGEFDEFFEPVSVVPPSTRPLISHTVSSSVKDDIWYISVTSDDVFEYRSVEVPFEVLDAIHEGGGPNRNYTESEWRSIGITQSKGWENYFRSFAELNVFMFRRPKPHVPPKEVLVRIYNQLRSDIHRVLRVTLDFDSEQTTCNQLRDCFTFPMIVFDPAMRSAFGLPPCDTSPIVQVSAVTSAHRLMEYQTDVLRFSLNDLKPFVETN